MTHDDLCTIDLLFSLFNYKFILVYWAQKTWMRPMRTSWTRWSRRKQRGTTVRMTVERCNAATFSACYGYLLDTMAHYGTCCARKARSSRRSRLSMRNIIIRAVHIIYYMRYIYSISYSQNWPPNLWQGNWQSLMSRPLAVDFCPTIKISNWVNYYPLMPFAAVALQRFGRSHRLYYSCSTSLGCWKALRSKNIMNQLRNWWATMTSRKGPKLSFVLWPDLLQNVMCCIVPQVSLEHVCLAAVEHQSPGIIRT